MEYAEPAIQIRSQSFMYGRPTLKYQEKIAEELARPSNVILKKLDTVLPAHKNLPAELTNTRPSTAPSLEQTKQQFPNHNFQWGRYGYVSRYNFLHEPWEMQEQRFAKGRKSYAYKEVDLPFDVKDNKRLNCLKGPAEYIYVRSYGKFTSNYQ